MGCFTFAPFVVLLRSECWRGFDWTRRCGYRSPGTGSRLYIHRCCPVNFIVLSVSHRPIRFIHSSSESVAGFVRCASPPLFGRRIRSTTSRFEGSRQQSKTTLLPIPPAFGNNQRLITTSEAHTGVPGVPPTAPSPPWSVRFATHPTVL
ncbi:hypothetical protein L209DRAFT_474074 [Thermothelomyces heterothallicus CBS 203.75]